MSVAARRFRSASTSPRMVCWHGSAGRRRKRHTSTIPGSHSAWSWRRVLRATSGSPHPAGPKPRYRCVSPARPRRATRCQRPRPSLTGACPPLSPNRSRERPATAASASGAGGTRPGVTWRGAPVIPGLGPRRCRRALGGARESEASPKSEAPVRREIAPDGPNLRCACPGRPVSARSVVKHVCGDFAACRRGCVGRAVAAPAFRAFGSPGQALKWREERAPRTGAARASRRHRWDGSARAAERTVPSRGFGADARRRARPTAHAPAPRCWSAGSRTRHAPAPAPR